MANRRRRENKMQHETLEQRGPRKGKSDMGNCENKSVYRSNCTLQKLDEPGILLANFAPEIESSRTPGSEQFQEETVDLQLDHDEQETQSNEQETYHTSSTQTEAFDYLYRSVESLSIKDCPRNDASTQTEEFDYFFTESATSKPFDKNYFREDNGKVSFYTGLPTYKVLEATFNHVSPLFCQTANTISYFISRDGHGSDEIKTLIGITPQGCISFVSEAQGGSTSHKHLTENCGLLNKLLPGDLVMADRGFTIHDGVALKQAQLVIPAFTKGREQLNPIHIEKTRGIAHVRIHVEI